ncbi:hypothetical protein ACFLQV_03410, partial [Calditrichota bacterium]
KIAASPAPAKTGARRGRPPKSEKAATAPKSVREKIAKFGKDLTAKPGAKRRGRPPKSATAASKPVKSNLGRSSGAVQLSNIDLELLNQVLSLKLKDKLALLDQLMR